MTKKILSILLLAALVLTPAFDSYAAVKTMSDGGKFDADYYASTYPDVVAALGTDAEVLYKHYLEFGKAEGRKPYADASNSSSQANIASTPQSNQIVMDLGSGVTLSCDRILKCWIVDTYVGSIEVLGAKIVSNKSFASTMGKVSFQYRVNDIGTNAPWATIYFLDEDGFELENKSMTTKRETAGKTLTVSWYMPVGTKTITIRGAY